MAGGTMPQLAISVGIVVEMVTETRSIFIF
jgi:hypothetical protein